VHRDARPTIEEVKDARLGSVVLQSDAANQSVKIRFYIEETDDFMTWIKRDEINEISIPLTDNKRFYRFALEDE
jgi:Trk K+ transport system NAD-binding subunit